MGGEEHQDTEAEVLWKPREGLFQERPARAGAAGITERTEEYALIEAAGTC